MDSSGHTSVIAQPAPAELSTAIEVGDLKLLKTLLDEGADPNALDAMGQTPLQQVLMSPTICTPRRYLAALRLLLAAGADVMITDPSGNTALHTACQYVNEHSVVKLLLDAGSCVHAINNSQQTALHILAKLPGPDPQYSKSVELLLSHGAKLNAKDCEGNTPRDLADIDVLAQFIRCERKRRRVESVDMTSPAAATNSPSAAVPASAPVATIPPTTAATSPHAAQPSDPTAPLPPAATPAVATRDEGEDCLGQTTGGTSSTRAAPTAAKDHLCDMPDDDITLIIAMAYDLLRKLRDQKVNFTSLLAAEANVREAAALLSADSTPDVVVKRWMDITGRSIKFHHEMMSNVDDAGALESQKKWQQSVLSLLMNCVTS